MAAVTAVHRSAFALDELAYLSGRHATALHVTVHLDTHLFNPALEATVMAATATGDAQIGTTPRITITTDRQLSGTATTTITSPGITTCTERVIGTSTNDAPEKSVEADVLEAVRARALR